MSLENFSFVFTYNLLLWRSIVTCNRCNIVSSHKCLTYTNQTFCMMSFNRKLVKLFGVNISKLRGHVCFSGAPRAKRAYGAPWVNKSTHPRKFGNHVTDRPSVCTTGIPMFTLTLSSYSGSPGESWLHINVVINWQLSKQGIRWPVSLGPIAGSGVDSSRSSIFWSYPLKIWSFSNDRRLTFTF